MLPRRANWEGAWPNWASCPAKPCASWPVACWRGRRLPYALVRVHLRCGSSRPPVSVYVRSSRSQLKSMEALPSAPSPLIALVGNPNCGKTALFNILTGSRQKVANYAGVTVERKEGSLLTPSGLRVRILDLPGAYSLDPLTPDEQVTADVLLGRRTGETQPDFVVCVTDATNLRQNLRLVLSLKRLGLPMVVALNMSDIARRKGIVIDAERLAAELGVPVVETVGVKATGVRALIKVLDGLAIPGRARQAAVWRTPR